MAETKKVIGYVMAPENDFYEGHVMRRVTQNLAGITVTLSETTTGMDFDEFTAANPHVPVDGRSAMSLVDDVSRMTDEQLAKMGLERMEGVEQAGPIEKEEELPEPKFTYPVHEGFGVYMFSDGKRMKMPKPAAPNAKIRQDELDAQEG